MLKQTGSPPAPEETATVSSFLHSPFTPHDNHDDIDLNLQLICWDDAQFQQHREAWQTLLSESQADPLFCSWDWLFNWWKIWQPRCKGQLKIVVAQTQGAPDDSCLIGLLPCFESQHQGQPVLQFIGSLYQSDDSVRSNYLGPILHHTAPGQLLTALLKILFSISSARFLYCADSPITHAPLWQQQPYLQHACYHDQGVKLTTCGHLADYLGLLGRNTRGQAFNARARLARHGTVSRQHYDGSNFSEFLNILDQLYRVRWHTGCYGVHSQQFLKLLAQSTLPLRGTILRLDGQPVAALLSATGIKNTPLSSQPNSHNGSQDHPNQTSSPLFKATKPSGTNARTHTASKQAYFLQLAFAGLADKRLKLGFLQLGYYIQDCFEDPDCQHLDLLPGKGKLCHYKSRFQGEHYHVQHLLIYRSRWHGYLAITKHRIKRQLINIIHGLQSALLPRQSDEQKK